MALFVEKLYTVLTDNAGVSAIIGTKLFPEFVEKPLENIPYLTYTVIDSIADLALDGLTDDQGPIRVQIDCFDSTYLQVKALEKAVRAAVADYHDSDMDLSIESSSDLGEPQPEGEEGVLRHVSIDIIAICRKALV